MKKRKQVNSTITDDSLFLALRKIDFNLSMDLYVDLESTLRVHWWNPFKYFIKEQQRQLDVYDFLKE